MSASGENNPTESPSLGRQGRAVLRVAGKQAGKNRWARAFYRGGSSFLENVGGAVHALWLEVTGFLFLVLAVIGAGATLREYHQYLAGAASRNRVALAAIFSLLFLYFGIESFVRARRKAKHK
jgi:hypothetical protein